MIVGEKATDFFDKLERVVSKPRFDSYKKNVSTNREALGRYIWNTSICESLYPSFQILEVGFRNAVHHEIAKSAKDQNWLINELSFLYEDEKEAIKSSKKSLMQRTGPITEDFLIAEMSFGFWTSLLDARYETMWHKIIAEVFPNMPRAIRTRGEASKLMNTVRRLRNAALHHHSIWHWKDLQTQHDQIHTLIGWLCSSIAKMAQRTDRFPEVYNLGGKQFTAIVHEISI